MHPLPRSHLSKWQKALQNISLCTSRHIIFSSSFFSLCKKEKFGATKFLFYVIFFLSFYTGHKNCLLSTKFWWMNIECLDVHLRFFVRFLWYFEMHFLCYRCICSYEQNISLALLVCRILVLGGCVSAWKLDSQSNNSQTFLELDFAPDSDPCCAAVYTIIKSCRDKPVDYTRPNW
jgi:hypothetical protein